MPAPFSPCGPRLLSSVVSRLFVEGRKVRSPKCCLTVPLSLASLDLLPSPDEPPARLLGVPFSDDPGACIDAAFSQKAAAMRAVAPLQIGLLGRAHVAQACMASKAVFVSSTSMAKARKKPPAEPAGERPSRSMAGR